MLTVVLAITVVVSATGFNFRVLLPVLASKTLHAGAAVFGVLFACFGVGALLGALGAAAMSRASWRALILGAAGFSGAMLLLAPVRNAVVAGALLLVIGFCFSTWTANSQSILQLTAPDRLRGRVLGPLPVRVRRADADRRPARRLARRRSAGRSWRSRVAGVGGLAATALAVDAPARRAPAAQARTGGRRVAEEQRTAGLVARAGLAARADPRGSSSGPASRSTAGGSPRPRRTSPAGTTSVVTRTGQLRLDARP